MEQRRDEVRPGKGVPTGVAKRMIRAGVGRGHLGFFSRVEQVHAINVRLKDYILKTLSITSNVLRWME